MPDPVISFGRTDVTTPTASYNAVRFVYLKGKAAVWQENKKAGSATRLLYATEATLVKPNSARLPIQIITPDEVWEVRQRNTGCGCGSPTKRIPITRLVDPDISSL